MNMIYSSLKGVESTGQTGFMVYDKPMVQITIKTTNPKCRLYWCFIEFNRLEIQSVMLVFSTPLVN